MKKQFSLMDVKSNFARRTLLIFALPIIIVLMLTISCRVGINSIAEIFISTWKGE